MIPPISFKTNQPTFQANINSPILNLTRDDFFIKIKGYGRNKQWADKVVESAHSAARMIQKNIDAEKILHVIALDISDANQLTDDISKRFKSGVLRASRLNWFGGYEKDLFTPYDHGRYSIYKDRFDYVENHPLKNINEKVGISRPYKSIEIYHSDPHYVNSSLDYILEIFNKTIPKFIHGELHAENLKEVNDTVAEIRWVLAHATPWMRGSDAISNVFMRAMYKAVGVKTYPPKNGISFDLEAYCTELDEYKKRFPTYFEKPPEVIE